MTQACRKEVDDAVNDLLSASRQIGSVEWALRELGKLAERQCAAGREPFQHAVQAALSDEERSIVHQALTDHYRKTLDEPIPALDGQTPRKAVKSAKGRKKVIAWLKMLENQQRSSVPRIRCAPTPSRGCGENSALGVRRCGKARHLGQRMANALPSPGPKSLWPILVVRESLTAR